MGLKLVSKLNVMSMSGIIYPYVSFKKIFNKSSRTLGN